MPTITVIVTVFKRTRFLEAAIRSVQAQSFADWECIVTDDAGTAEARDLCEGFARDERVRYRRNKRTLGAPLNIAAALQEATGRYVAILNDDDILYPTMFQALLTPLESSPRSTLAFGNHDILDENGSVLVEDCARMSASRHRVHLAAGVVPNSYGFALRYGVMSVMGCLLRRSAIDVSWLVSEVAGAYDYWLSVKVAGQGDFFFVPETVMGWRRHPESATCDVSREKYGGEIFIFERLSDTPVACDAWYARSQLASFLYLRGILYLHHGWEADFARRLIIRSLRLKWHFPALRHLLLSFLPRRARQAALKTGSRLRCLFR